MATIAEVNGNGVEAAAPVKPMQSLAPATAAPPPPPSTGAPPPPAAAAAAASSSAETMVAAACARLVKMTRATTSDMVSMLSAESLAALEGGAKHLEQLVGDEKLRRDAQSELTKLAARVDAFLGPGATLEALDEPTRAVARGVHALLGSGAPPGAVRVLRYSSLVHAPDVDADYMNGRWFVVVVAERYVMHVLVHEYDDADTDGSDEDSDDDDREPAQNAHRVAIVVAPVQSAFMNSIAFDAPNGSTSVPLFTHLSKKFGTEEPLRKDDVLIRPGGEGNAYVVGIYGDSEVLDTMLDSVLVSHKKSDPVLVAACVCVAHALDMYHMVSASKKLREEVPLYGAICAGKLELFEELGACAEKEAAKAAINATDSDDDTYEPDFINDAAEEAEDAPDGGEGGDEADEAVSDDDYADDDEEDEEDSEDEEDEAEDEDDDEDEHPPKKRKTEEASPGHAAPGAANGHGIDAKRPAQPAAAVIQPVSSAPTERRTLLAPGGSSSDEDVE